MMLDSDHGGGRADNVYCQFCTDAVGSLKAKQEVREGTINFYVESFGKTREEAEVEVDSRMSQMPAWMNQSPVNPVPVQPVQNEVSPVMNETPVAQGNPVVEVAPVQATGVVPQPESMPVVSPEPVQPVEPLTEQSLNNPATQVISEEQPVQEVSNVPGQPVVENNQVNPVTSAESVNTNTVPSDNQNPTGGN